MKTSNDIGEDYRRRLGQRLRSVREKLGETQAKFAQRLDVIPLSVHKYEVGASCPSSETLHNLENTGVDACYVAFGVPSLGSPQARKNFVAALAWVRRECAIASLHVSEEDLAEAAWIMFCKLSENAIPGESGMAEEAKRAISEFQTSTDAR